MSIYMFDIYHIYPKIIYLFCGQDPQFIFLVLYVQAVLSISIYQAAYKNGPDDFTRDFFFDTKHFLGGEEGGRFHA